MWYRNVCILKFVIYILHSSYYHETPCIIMLITDIIVVIVSEFCEMLLILYTLLNIQIEKPENLNMKKISLGDALA